MKRPLAPATQPYTIKKSPHSVSRCGPYFGWLQEPYAPEALFYRRSGEIGIDCFGRDWAHDNDRTLRPYGSHSYGYHAFSGYVHAVRHCFSPTHHESLSIILYSTPKINNIFKKSFPQLVVECNRLENDATKNTINFHPVAARQIINTINKNKMR